jgi:hypothetical protein
MNGIKLITRIHGRQMIADRKGEIILKDIYLSKI